MRRDLSIVTDEVKNLIISWIGILAPYRYGKCPFEEKKGIPLCPTICYAIFPKLESIDPDSDIVCPCDVYRNSYVLKSSQGDHQMKCKSIQFSDFVKASSEGCCSPRRFLNSCEDCDQVKKCKHPEGMKGRTKILAKQIRKAKEEIKKLRKEQDALKNKLQ